MVGISSILDNPSFNDPGFNAPNFDIKIQGGRAPLGVRQLVQQIEYESSDGMADLMRITFRDPGLIPPKGLKSIGPISGFGGIGGSGSGTSVSLRDTKVIQPGNEISVFFGYGTQLKHIGRAIIRKIRVTYPRSEIPSLEVIAYTKDSVMSDNAPEKSKKKKGKGGRLFNNATYADAVTDRANDYGFELDIDKTNDKPHNFIQKVGLSDYDFVKGISNITGYYFWVDGDSDGKWTLHFKNPEKMQKDIIQDKEYNLEYDQGNYGTLLEFEPELAIQGAITKLKAIVKHYKTGKNIEVTFSEENNKSPDPIAEGEPDLSMSNNKLQGEHTTGSDIKLFINDFSFNVITQRKFQDEGDLIDWAKQWFRRNRENFILASASTIGIENIMARQIHRLSGLGGGLDGKYFFSTVTHRMSAGSGYELECNVRKVVPELA